MLKMAPPFAGDHVADRLLVNSKSIGYFALGYPRQVQRADDRDINGRDFCSRIKFSSHRLGATLSNLIRNVVRVSPKKQMLGVATPSVIAVMEHVKAVWNRPICLYPRHSVGAKSALPVPRDAIAGVVDAAIPPPTAANCSPRYTGPKIGDHVPFRKVRRSRSLPSRVVHFAQAARCNVIS